jgi:hypothetical protein
MPPIDSSLFQLHRQGRFFTKKTFTYLCPACSISFCLCFCNSSLFWFTFRQKKNPDPLFLSFLKFCNFFKKKFVWYYSFALFFFFIIYHIIYIYIYIYIIEESLRGMHNIKTSGVLKYFQMSLDMTNWNWNRDAVKVVRTTWYDYLRNFLYKLKHTIELARLDSIEKEIYLQRCCRILILFYFIFHFCLHFVLWLATYSFF